METNISNELLIDLMMSLLVNGKMLSFTLREENKMAEYLYFAHIEGVVSVTKNVFSADKTVETEELTMFPKEAFELAYESDESLYLSAPHVWPNRTMISPLWRTDK